MLPCWGLRAAQLYVSMCVCMYGVCVCVCAYTSMLPCWDLRAAQLYVGVTYACVYVSVYMYDNVRQPCVHLQTESKATYVCVCVCMCVYVCLSKVTKYVDTYIYHEYIYTYIPTDMTVYHRQPEVRNWVMHTHTYLHTYPQTWLCIIASPK